MPTIRGIPGCVLGSDVVYFSGGCLNAHYSSYPGMRSWFWCSLLYGRLLKCPLFEVSRDAFLVLM
jgi:hypothetical protein